MAKSATSTSTIAHAAETTVYAAIGLGELFTERTRAVSSAAGRLQAQVKHDLQAARGTSVHDASNSLRTASGKALNAGLARAEKAQSDFVALAERGQHIVADILTRPEVKQAATRLDSTVTAGKGAASVVLKAIDDTGAQAKATVTTGRKGAARIADVVAKAVSDDAAQVTEVARAEVKRAGAAVRRAPKIASARTASPKIAPAKKAPAKKAAARSTTGQTSPKSAASA